LGILGGAWITLLSAAPAYLIATAVAIGPDGQFGASTTGMVAGVTIAALLAGIGLGAWLGRLRQWVILLCAAAAGTAVGLGWYVVAFAILQPDDPLADNEAGAGLALLCVPTFLCMVVILGVGAGPGYVVSRYRRAAAP
jgi:hypothetical protein